MPTSFVAVYRGDTIAAARLIAVSADPFLVSDVTSRILQEQLREDTDPVVATLEHGRRAALRLIKQEAGNGVE
jgi:hypothetical protein